MLPVTGELDLHAFAPRDVVSVVAEYLDECARRGIRTVRLAHGRGKGVQRAEVRHFEIAKPWDVRGIEGVHRFLGRAWRAVDDWKQAEGDPHLRLRHAVIKAVTVYVAMATIVLNLLADLIYKALDPRVELK